MGLYLGKSLKYSDSCVMVKIAADNLREEGACQ